MGTDKMSKCAHSSSEEEGGGCKCLWWWSLFNLLGFLGSLELYVLLLWYVCYDVVRVSMF